MTSALSSGSSSLFAMAHLASIGWSEKPLMRNLGSFHIIHHPLLPESIAHVQRHSLGVIPPLKVNSTATFSG